MASLTHFFRDLYMKSKKQYSNEIEVGLAEILDSFASITDDSQLPKFNSVVDSQFDKLQVYISQDNFMIFMTNLAMKQETIKLWFQFLTNDCLAYFGLYVAIRHQNWQLRTASLKLMAAVFEALDKPTYQKLIPQHLKDIASMPNNVLQHLQAGRFNARLSTNMWHGNRLEKREILSWKKFQDPAGI